MRKLTCFKSYCGHEECDEERTKGTNNCIEGGSAGQCVKIVCQSKFVYGSKNFPVLLRSVPT